MSGSLPNRVGFSSLSMASASREHLGARLAGNSVASSLLPVL